MGRAKELVAKGLRRWGKQIWWGMWREKNLRGGVGMEDKKEFTDGSALELSPNAQFLLMVYNMNLTGFLLLVERSLSSMHRLAFELFIPEELRKEFKGKEEQVLVAIEWKEYAPEELEQLSQNKRIGYLLLQHIEDIRKVLTDLYKFMDEAEEEWYNTMEKYFKSRGF